MELCMSLSHTHSLYSKNWLSLKYTVFDVRLCVFHLSLTAPVCGTSRILSGPLIFHKKVLIMPSSPGILGQFHQDNLCDIPSTHILCSTNISSHIVQSFSELLSYLEMFFPCTISGVFQYIHQCQPLAPGHPHVLLLFLTSVVSENTSAFLKTTCSDPPIACVLTHGQLNK